MYLSLSFSTQFSPSLPRTYSMRHSTIPLLTHIRISPPPTATFYTNRTPLPLLQSDPLPHLFSTLSPINPLFLQTIAHAPPTSIHTFPPPPFLDYSMRTLSNSFIPHMRPTTHATPFSTTRTQFFFLQSSALTPYFSAAHSFIHSFNLYIPYFFLHIRCARLLPPPVTNPHFEFQLPYHIRRYHPGSTIYPTFFYIPPTNPSSFLPQRTCPTTFTLNSHSPTTFVTTIQVPPYILHFSTTHKNPRHSFHNVLALPPSQIFPPHTFYATRPSSAHYNPLLVRHTPPPLPPTQLNRNIHTPPSTTDTTTPQYSYFLHYLLSRVIILPPLLPTPFSYPSHFS